LENQNTHININETKRLYFENATQTEFEALVLALTEREGRPALVLDQTCFYPESGGQPADRGTINGVRVVKVLDEEGTILHLLEKEISTAGVAGRVDWTTRFDHMQQHTGQHILSQAFYERLRGETLSFHLGETNSTLEIGVRKISDEELAGVEILANRVVFEDREIKAYFLPEDRIAEIPLRKPPKKQGLIRVVEVACFDYSACGGTHCRRAGEVGLIKITKWEKIRDNLRFEFVCGRRALRDYETKNGVLRRLGNQMSVKPEEIPDAIGRMAAELKASQKKIKKMQERLAEYEAQEILQKTEGKIIQNIFSDKTAEEAKFLALNIIRRGDFIVLYGVRGEQKDHLILAAAESVGRDMRKLVPVVTSFIKAKGGGSPSLVELVADERIEFRSVLNKINESLNER
jgi:alanyl-tRNA synthetase